MAEVQLTPNTNISTIAASYPAAVRMLEALGIDYCCGGKRTLVEAAAGIGMPVDRLIAILNTTMNQEEHAEGRTRDWQTAPLDELMTHILQTHHSYLRRELPRLDEMLQKVERAHGAVHGDVLTPLAQTFRTLAADIAEHLTKEEHDTFPAIARLMSGVCEESVLRTVAELEHEHDDAGTKLEAMRVITHEYLLPRDACTTFGTLYTGLQELERDLHQHIHLENNILFPRVRQLAQECGKKAA